MAGEGGVQGVRARGVFCADGVWRGRGAGGERMGGMERGESVGGQGSKERGGVVGGARGQ